MTLAWLMIAVVLGVRGNNMIQENKMTAEQYIKQQKGYLRQILWFINANKIGELHTLKTKEDKK